MFASYQMTINCIIKMTCSLLCLINMITLHKWQREREWMDGMAWNRGKPPRIYSYIGARGALYWISVRNQWMRKYGNTYIKWRIKGWFNCVGYLVANIDGKQRHTIEMNTRACTFPLTKTRARLWNYLLYFKRMSFASNLLFMIINYN